MDAVTHGADVERLAGVATDLSGSAHRVRGVASIGSSLLTMLAEHWRGPDVEDYRLGWDGACRSMETAADRLDIAAAALRDQADQQSGASEGGTAVAVGASTPAPSPHPAEDDDDDSGAKIGVGTGLDQGAKIIWGPLPEGLDHTNPVVADLRQTPEGRAWLAWLADNDITVVEGGSFSQYSAGSNTISLGNGADATSLIHEATHAQWDVAGQGVDVTAVSREEYINSQLDNEVNAVTAEVAYLQATSEDPSAISDQAFIDYTQAQSAALANGASPEDAETAGRAAVRELFTSGYYSPSISGDDEVTYMDYYGEFWDGRNP